MRQCQKCGNIVLDSQTVCARCGAPMPKQPERFSSNQTVLTSAMPMMGRSASSVETVKPVESVQTTESTQPVEPVQTAEPVEINEPAEPVKMGEPVELEKPIDPAKPIELETSVNPLMEESPVDEPMFEETTIEELTALEPTKEEIVKEEPPKEEPAKEESKPIAKKLIIIDVIAAVVILAIIIISVILINGGGIFGGDANNTMVSESKVRVGEYLLTIPQGYDYEVEEDGSVTLTNNAETWLANMYYINNATYDMIKEGLSDVADYYLTMPGVSEIKDTGILTAGGREYLYMDIESLPGAATGTYAYTRLGDRVLQVILEKSDNSFDHGLFADLNTIVDRAEKVTGIENDFNNGRERVRVYLVDVLHPIFSEDGGFVDKSTLEETTTEAQ